MTQLIFGSPDANAILCRDGGFDFNLQGVDPLVLQPIPAARHARLAEEMGQADEEVADWCRVCGGPMDWEDCWQCGGKGGRDGDDLMAEAPMWYSEDDFEVCEECDGRGGYWQCINLPHEEAKQGSKEGDDAAWDDEDDGVAS